MYRFMNPASNKIVADGDEQISTLKQAVAERDEQIAELRTKEAALQARLSQLYLSSSWRITAPLRKGVQGMRAIRAASSRIILGQFLLMHSMCGSLNLGLRSFFARSRRFLRGHNTKSCPLVSFIIPVHNHPTNIVRAAIRSALNQIFPDIEVILVTNNSPPEILAVLDEFRNDPRVRIFSYYRDNTGNAVRGRNKGILEARGDYIAFLDSDDIAKPNRVELSLPLLMSRAADVVYGARQVMMDGTRKVEEGYLNGTIVTGRDCDLEILLETCEPCQSTVMLRKSLLKAVGVLKPQMHYREDHELWLRLARHGAVFKSIPQVLTRLRLHGGNTELNFKTNDAYWKNLMMEEYKKPGPQPKKVAFILGGVGLSGGTAIIFKHIMMLMSAGHDAFAINLGDAGDGGAWFTGNTAPVVHISDKRAYLFDNIDLLFATGWQTVEWLARIPARRKLYFVQSDERRFVDEPSLKAKIHEGYNTRCEYLTEALWIQKMLRTEFGRRSAYVPNGIDPHIMYPDSPLEPKNPKRLRVLIEGPICIPFKGMDDAHAAIAPLDCEIWIVSSAGQPKTGWRYDRFFERVPFGEMRKIYSSCDIFLKMSRVEGFFGPPMEAMACGCSVVVGKVTGYEEYIVHEENALVVEQGDIEGARVAVQRLLDDHAVRDRLVKRGFETVNAWTWDRSAQAMLELVEKPESHWSLSNPPKYVETSY
jgi:O-antigen biosynthesis protein